MASSRSMEPVELQESYPVTEVFAEDVQSDADIEALEEDLILPIEGGKIDLSESVADNILLNIPLKVLTPEEEAGPVSYTHLKEMPILITSNGLWEVVPLMSLISFIFCRNPTSLSRQSVLEYMVILFGEN